MPEIKSLLESLTSGDDERAESSIPAIVELGAAALAPLVDLTRARDTDSRWWAVRALAELPDARAAHLIPLLKDSAPDVRAAAALALSNHPEESAIPALIESLGDKDALAASMAMTALVKIGKSAVEALIESAKTAKTGVRILSLRALSELKDHRAIPVLMNSMSEESAALNYWAQVGLERLGLDMVYIKP